jgi:hypothetical protein
LFWTWVSEKIDQRFLLGIVAEVWCLVPLIALAVLPDGSSPWVLWILNVILIGAPYVHAIVVAMTSRNAGSVATRTVASALYNMMVQVSNIIGNNVGYCRFFRELHADINSQIYREHDKPYYRVGNRVLIALAAWSLVLFIFAKWYYVRRNKYVHFLNID